MGAVAGWGLLAPRRLVSRGTYHCVCPPGAPSHRRIQDALNQNVVYQSHELDGRQRVGQRCLAVEQAE
jgi:hypothetical protein